MQILPRRERMWPRKPVQSNPMWSIFSQPTSSLIRWRIHLRIFKTEASFLRTSKLINSFTSSPFTCCSTTNNASNWRGRPRLIIKMFAPPISSQALVALSRKACGTIYRNKKALFHYLHNTSDVIHMSLRLDAKDQPQASLILAQGVLPYLSLWPRGIARWRLARTFQACRSSYRSRHLPR